MMIRRCCLLPLCLMLAACAGNQEIENPQFNTDTVVALNSTDLAEASDRGLELCSEKAYGDQDRLDQNCLNRVDGLPNGGKRHNPVGRREKKELRSLCDNMFLPKCRHK